MTVSTVTSGLHWVMDTLRRPEHAEPGHGEQSGGTEPPRGHTPQPCGDQQHPRVSRVMISWTSLTGVCSPYDVVGFRDDQPHPESRPRPLT